MDIPLHKLNYSFQKKPLLVGGMAMEYYGLRKSGADIDFIAEKEDVYNLIQRYPQRVKDLWGDLGVCPFEFEIWKSICLFTHADLRENAIDAGEYLVISREKLLLLKSFAMHIEKYKLDVQLLVQDLQKTNYQQFDQVRAENLEFTGKMPEIVYIEKTGPEK
jgi:hypothetical protein